MAISFLSLRPLSIFVCFSLSLSLSFSFSFSFLLLTEAICQNFDTSQQLCLLLSPFKEHLLSLLIPFKTFLSLFHTSLLLSIFKYTDIQEVYILLLLLYQNYPTYSLFYLYNLFLWVNLSPQNTLVFIISISSTLFSFIF